MTNEQSYRDTLKAEPGNPLFADYAARLVAEERFHDAIIVCLQGLSVNPELHRGRLILSHALFRAGYTPFAAREVQVLLDTFPANPHLVALLQKLAPGMAVTPSSPDSNPLDDGAPIADVEFELDDLEELGRPKK